MDGYIRWPFACKSVSSVPIYYKLQVCEAALILYQPNTGVPFGNIFGSKSQKINALGTLNQHESPNVNV